MAIASDAKASARLSAAGAGRSIAGTAASRALSPVARERPAHVPPPVQVAPLGGDVVVRDRRR
ncbi:hypothetical protein [Demequina lignilytica]|uniref:Uncharacterized protein n=1 Tax=Demequina lignilytica TaxID=3051663 RepID=A0AB35MDU2_9MICO|nr:hypothetical protein [Demequina sp. SYSU T0a273]MDN4481920.1 hypothetical protein [Demequina sp. SYSU T0a273]